MPTVEAVLGAKRADDDDQEGAVVVALPAITLIVVYLAGALGGILGIHEHGPLRHRMGLGLDLPRVVDGLAILGEEGLPGAVHFGRQWVGV